MLNWIRRRNPASKVRPKARLALENLEDRMVLSTASAPAIDTIADVSLPNGGPLFVPVTASSFNNSLVTYSAASSDSNVTVVARQGFGYLDIKVKGMGDMIYQLYSDIAPNTVSTIATLVQQGFYTNLTFHRVVANFVIQGGDPKGDGTGGPGFSFSNEIGPLSLFNGTGQLAMANSGGTSTNGSQFFATIGPQTNLNGKHTIFGQLVRGFDIEDKIARMPVDSNSKPLTPVVIESATIIPDYTDTVLLVQAPAGYNADPKIVVTATSAGGTSTKTFHVQVGDGGVDLQRIQFVNRTFSTVLQRPAESTAVDYYTGLLANNKVTTNQVALEVQTSLESRINTVKSIFQTMLNRQPEAQALTNNTIYLMQGGSVAHLQAVIAASQEYFEAKGGSNSAWIASVFKDATGATSVPLNYTTQVSAMLDQGLKRQTYADTIFSSLPAGVLTVQNLFNQFLERKPTIADATPLAQLLASGTSEDLIVMTIVGSNEFFQFTKNQNAG